MRPVDPKRKSASVYTGAMLRMANISKRKVLVIAGVVACVFACAIVALLEFDSLGRPTPSARRRGHRLPPAT